MLSGDNGILQRATEAKTNTDSAQIKERIQLAYHSALTKDITGADGELTLPTLQAELEKEFVGKTVTITPNNEKTEWEIEVDNVKVSVKAGKDDTLPQVIVAISPTEYGKKVTNYREGEDWEIFYQGSVEEGAESRIYLIRTNATARSDLKLADSNNVQYGGTTDFNDATKLSTKYPAVAQGLLYKTYKTQGTETGLKYISTYNNIKATQWLLDSTNWTSYKDIVTETHPTQFADYVIGGPTLELLVASYNAKHEDESRVNIANPESYGYNDVLVAGTLPGNTDGSNPWNHWENYWAACPASDIRVIN